MNNSSLKIAVIAGEESGDLLGADLISSLSKQTECNIYLIGVGGRHLEALGLKSFFDFNDIALIGLGAVLKKLPLLLMHIRNLSKFIVQEQPDCLIIIDSPDFTHRVAKRVRTLAPSIPIIQYVAPTVWAWRPERAKIMRKFVDHILAIFPFEEKIIKDLNGPDTTYVGHRLLTYPPLLAVQSKKKRLRNEPILQPTIVVLPGSRRSEIRSLMPIFGQAIEIVKQRIPHLRIILPTLPYLINEIHLLTQDWKNEVEIVVGEDEKWSAFAEADVALAALGTVSLELALARIPMILCYKLDYFFKLFFFSKVLLWSSALPNIIADKPVVSEYFNEFLRPGMLARQIEQLLHNHLLRHVQFDSFDIIETKMKTEVPSEDIAAQTIIRFLKEKTEHKKLLIP
ncbi:MULTISPECIES: lipid-A-disaccharide synthase [Bartonella]|uniref:Lipid-A-disaccharide synthase n=1 Tax=Bartonella rochalimae ATCC BAA-1498 TaxID=685782 RepID=E6YM58_9HYPH|nr:MULTISPECIES: lipid-A-disaccharide synthase [Bartonella]AQX18243.1 lipid-A-disaccharide synthase [Bartonella sp. A1379B]AQX22758.1 lipid-A-disaccharide synthase [Bartonella sp. 11B]AQX23955.1 lipid-A-disaccharide synthase [Bartonella sp. 114]AQX25208.1 lipid-A-disaccharide synthase [Bartonella sp. Coyote22sub2]KEC56936.1 lipid-A-disaccharide synthase [Bartonella rochalimae ATCC BAA-1498]